MRGKLGRSRTAAALAGMAVMVSAAVPAQATVRERYRAEDQPYEFAYDCGFPVQVSGSFDEAYIIREGKNRDSMAFPVLHRLQYSETHTNADTGEWFTAEGHVIFNEVEATRVDGSVFEFRFVAAGQPFVIRDAAGEVVSRNRGSLHGSFLFDTMGDDEPGGDWIADVDFRIAGPHPDLGPDLCPIAGELIG